MKLILAMIALLTAQAAWAQNVDMDEGALFGRVIVAGALCPDVELDDAAVTSFEEKGALDVGFRDRVANSMEHMFPVLLNARGTKQFSDYCRLMHGAATRLGLTTN